MTRFDKDKYRTHEESVLLFILALSSLYLMKFRFYEGAIFFVVFVVLAIINFKLRIDKKNKKISAIKELVYTNDELMKRSLINLPVPMCIIDFEGYILWNNDELEHIVNDKSPVIGRQIDVLIPDIKLRKNLNDEGLMYTMVDFRDRKYTIAYNVIKIKKEDSAKYYLVLYWFDNTDVTEMKEKIENSKNVIALIEVDGYSDVLRSVNEERRPQIKMELETIISELEDFTSGALVQISKSNYILVMDSENLKRLEASKFNVLDRVRQIEHGKGLPVTISIGVGHKGETINENLELATGALDLALGRGGDQAIIKTEDNFLFFGGKSKAVEKKTKVKSRLIGHALKQIFEQAEHVLIMGHKYPDMDALGAAVGIYDLCKFCGVKANVVLNEVNEGVEIFVSKIEEDPYYDNMFINHEDAIAQCNENTVVVVVDTHRPNYSECNELLGISKRVVVIDHHRRGVEFINDTILLFHEIYVSSTCEMVTELVQYMDDEITINELTAEGLMAGIYLDTKNFAFKTGVRTFEAASYLKAIGADTTQVKTFFNTELEDFIARAEILKNTIIIDGKICLSYSHDEIKNINIVIAKSADKLLDIKEVEASFVLGKKGDDIFISARSLGNINVQVLMEKLGGGGHIDIAGAQLYDRDLDEAIESVKHIIEDYLREEKENEGNIS